MIKPIGALAALVSLSCLTFTGCQTTDPSEPLLPKDPYFGNKSGQHFVPKELQAE